MNDAIQDKPSRLGRGLASLLPGATGAASGEAAAEAHERGVHDLAVSVIAPGALQPRRNFDAEEMASLIRSVKEKGVLQPILVRPAGADAQTGGIRYEIIAGERRWRAAQAAQLHEIPAVIRELDDGTALEIALIENIQRDSLTALEEAEGYRRLIDQFGHTQEAVAQAVGKSRSHVANTLRLLTLPKTVKAHLDENRLTAGHARALLGAPDCSRLAEEIVAKGLNVRQAERLAKKAAAGTGTKSMTRRARSVKSPDILALERRLSNEIGLPVDISFDGAGGRMTMIYKNLDQLDDLIERLSSAPALGDGPVGDEQHRESAEPSNITSFPGGRGKDKS